MKYRVDTTLMICLKHVEINVDDDIGSKDDFEDELSDAVMQVAERRLTLLDINGGRSGNDGFIKHMQCEGVEDWEKL